MAKTCGVLVAIGGLNWGLVGLGMLCGVAGGWIVVNMIFGSWPIVEGIVYLLVGIATVMVLIGCKCAKCKACANGAAGAAPMGGAKM